jgi:uncharacterized membrane protein YqjE
MDDSTVSLERCAVDVRACARRLLTICENRIELLTVEAQEERERLCSELLSTLVVASLGLLAGMTLTAAIVMAAWAYSHAGTLLLLTLLYAGAAAWLWQRLATARRSHQAFACTREQLGKDRVLLAEALA